MIDSHYRHIQISIIVFILTDSSPDNHSMSPVRKPVAQKSILKIRRSGQEQYFQVSSRQGLHGNGFLLQGIGPGNSDKPVYSPASLGGHSPQLKIPFIP